MKRVAILGCENSHADTFLKVIKEKYTDVSVVGVYSKERAAAERLEELFGVRVMDAPSDVVGEIDGLIITARHGDEHFAYAKPYIASGIPMFIDKPITVSEEEALLFMRELRKAGVRICGGSLLKNTALVRALKEKGASLVDGRTVGGALRAPISMENAYGGFFFYAQHLVEMACEIFGRYPKSVCAHRTLDTVNVLFSYGDFAVNGTFCDKMYTYYAARYAQNGVEGGPVCITEEASYQEVEDFYRLLLGEEQRVSYEDFISPVFIMNAIVRAMESGREEPVRSYEL